MSNELTITRENAKPLNVWTEAASEASPIQGTNFVFNGGGFFTTRDKTQIGADRQFAVLGRSEGFQKLEAGCPPEFVVRRLGEPKPEQPFVDQKDWRVNLSGQPEHPFKYTWYLHLVDVASGESMTFSTSTIGGTIGLRELTDQIVAMQKMQPAALPVVKLASATFKTSFGPKPRPAFLISSWRNAAPVEEPELIEVQPDFDDSLDEFLKH